MLSASVACGMLRANFDHAGGVQTELQDIQSQLKQEHADGKVLHTQLTELRRYQAHLASAMSCEVGVYLENDFWPPSSAADSPPRHSAAFLPASVHGGLLTSPIQAKLVHCSDTSLARRRMMITRFCMHSMSRHQLTSIDFWHVAGWHQSRGHFWAPYPTPNSRAAVSAASSPWPLLDLHSSIADAAKQSNMCCTAWPQQLPLQ